MTPPLATISDDSLSEAAKLLRAGKLVAFPTETVYGLGAAADQVRAVAAIFAAKGRPRFNPLISHVASVEAARALADFDDVAEELAARFWPGALTLVLPRRADAPVSKLVSAGLPTLALRVPSHPVASRLIAMVGGPVAAPSANLSGRLSPTRAVHVRDQLGDAVAMILDGGPCDVGLESTIVGITAGRARLLRPGGISAESIEAAVGPLDRPAELEGAPAVEAPGMMASHYAPLLPVRLNAAKAEPGEVLLGFGPGAPDGPNLSPTGDLVEAAANLFDLLDRLDRTGARRIAVMPVPETGLGRAINDRLRRAAAPRPAAQDKEIGRRRCQP